jgi:hypothetical protein
MAKQKTHKAHKPRAPKAQQQYLEGMDPPSIPEIDQASDRFVDARNEWQALHAPMLEARKILEATMKKHQLEKYEYDGKVVQFVAEQKIKVSTKKIDKVDLPTSENGDDDDDDD